MKCDLVILAPMICQTDYRRNINGLICDEDVFIEQMNKILAYEVFDSVHKNVSRFNIGKYTLKFYKNWPDFHVAELPLLKGNVYITVDEQTGICICEIVFLLETETELTYYLDAIPKDDIYIDCLSDGNFIKLREFVERLGFEQVGVPKSAVFLSEKPKKRFLTYILASEFYMVNDEAFIDSETLNDKLKIDLSQYDFMNCYGTANSMVSIMRLFFDDFGERLYYEGMSIFLVELILFQIAAISRTNNRVVELLSKGEMPSLDTIKEINLQYAQTITLWNINIFRSTTAQIAANKMYRAFEVPELIEQYERNQRMMEHIISIIDQIQDNEQSEKQDEENNILGVLALFAIVSAICDGFGTIDSIRELEDTLGSISSLGILDWISIGLKVFLFVYIIILSLPSVAVVYRNRRRKKKEKK